MRKLLKAWNVIEGRLVLPINRSKLFSILLLHYLSTQLYAVMKLFSTFFKFFDTLQKKKTNKSKTVFFSGVISLENFKKKKSEKKHFVKYFFKNTLL